MSVKVEVDLREGQAGEMGSRYGDQEGVQEGE